MLTDDSDSQTIQDPALRVYPEAEHILSPGPDVSRVLPGPQAPTNKLNSVTYVLKPVRFSGTGTKWAVGAPAGALIRSKLLGNKTSTRAKILKPYVFF